MSEEPDDTEDLRIAEHERIMEAMSSIEGRLTKVEEAGEKILDGLDTATLELEDHSRTLFGHQNARRRQVEPGIVHVVSELASAFQDVRAVAKAGWAMLSLVGITTVISLVSLFVRLG